MHYKKGLASVWAVLITVIVMLGLAGGGYYYWHSKTVKDKSDLNKKITDLTVELATLKKASTASTAATSATTSESGLKTYTNTTYGYLFKYPTADSLIDYLYDGQAGTKIEYGKIVMVDKNAIAENALKSESEISNRYFMVTVQTDHEFGLSELTSNMGDMGGVLTDTTVDGVAAWKIHYTQPNIMSETYNTSIYVNHGGYGITLDIKNSDSAGTHDAAIDAIIASFKWL
jgi:hypothetical protein